MLSWTILLLQSFLPLPDCYDAQGSTAQNSLREDLKSAKVDDIPFANEVRQCKNTFVSVL